MLMEPTPRFLFFSFFFCVYLFVCLFVCFFTCGSATCVSTWNSITECVIVLATSDVVDVGVEGGEWGGGSNK